MKKQFRLYPRANGVFYCEDIATGKQVSLHTEDRVEAERLLHARNEAHRQPMLNLQMAQTYLSASDPAVAARTWQDVMAEIVKDKTKIFCGYAGTRHDHGCSPHQSITGRTLQLGAGHRISNSRRRI